jgi:demethylmenaquinone methyltransferase/2-methoxy-6-polyprenyl-1,4-benzoquinol methylase
VRPDHFALFAPFYDRLFANLDHDRLKSLLDLPVEGRILDAGGGTGRVAEALSGQAAQIVVADESAAMLRVADGKRGMVAVGARAQQLPFADAGFQRIILVDAFHHLGDQRAAAMELWRVLAPGGRLVIEDPDIRRLPVKLLALAERMAMMRSRFLTPDSMGEMFRALGGRVEVQDDGRMMAWVVADRDR